MLPTVLCVVILFLSTLTRSTFGFGEALLAMPLLTLVVGVQVATPLVGLVAVTIAVLIIAQVWRDIDFAGAWRLLLAAALGIPLGALSVRFVAEDVVVAGLGGFLVLFGLYRLLGPTLPELRLRGWVYLFGFVAGLLGGAYNTSGPPVVLYGILRRWSPARFRATLQGYFLPSSLVIVASHWAAGLWTSRMLELYLLALPGVLAGVWLGGRINDRLPVKRFEQLLFLLLIVLGLLLLT